MKAKHIVVLASVICAAAVIATAQITDCKAFNFPKGPFSASGAQGGGHVWGSHSGVITHTGQCTYTGHVSGQACDTTANASTTTVAGDTGLLVNPLTKHEPATKDVGNTASAVGPVNVATQGAFSFAICPFLGCPFSIQILPGGLVTASGATPMYTVEDGYTLSCPQKILPPPPKNCSDTGTTCPSGERWVPYPVCACNVSPLLADTTGGGIQMDDQVTFDFKGNGKPEKFWWPTHGSGNKWLVHLKPGEMVTSGKQMFSSLHPHADAGVKGHPDPNGFLALGWYDRPSMGGNLDGMVSQADRIWNGKSNSKDEELWLWEDKHCYLTPDVPCDGSHPGELSKPQDNMLNGHGIESFGLRYDVLTSADSTGDKVDVHGNDFRLVAPVNVKAGKLQESDDPRKVVDVWVARVKKHQNEAPVLPKE